MSTELVPNSFTEYKLDDLQQIQGSIYNELQLQVLHNHLSSYAEEKIALDYDPEHPLLFAQDEASLKGKIELLQYLIDTSNASLEILIDNTTTQE